MRLKVDESLNVGYTKETVQLDTTMENAQLFLHSEQVYFTDTAARIAPIKSAPYVGPRSSCGMSCVDEDIVDKANFVSNAVISLHYISRTKVAHCHLFFYGL